MVSLWKDPAGEIKLTSVPAVTATTTGLGAAAKEEDEKIIKLRNTISSLRSELRAVSISYFI